MFRRFADSCAEALKMHPVPSAAAAFLSGLALAFAFPAASGFWPVLAVAGAFGAAVCIGWNLRGWILPAIFLSGAILAQRTECAAYSQERLLSSPEPDGAPVCEFKVLSDAIRKRGPRGKPVWEFLSKAGPLDVAVSIPGGDGSVRPLAGETWRCRGWLLRGKAQDRRFARRRFSCNQLRGGGAERTQTPRSVLAAALARLRSALSRNAGIGLDGSPAAASMNRALLLGERSSLPSARRSMFVDAGTIHVFAISGLHVMIVAKMLQVLLGFFRLRPEVRTGALIVSVFLYAAVTGARPSALRAACMAGMYFSAPFAGRRPDVLVAWSATALVTYSLRPELFFNAGCTLSFVVMFGVVLWCRWSQRLPSAFAGLYEAARMQRAAGRTFRAFLLFQTAGLSVRLASMFAVSCAAWIAGTPPAASLFGRFTPGGLVSGVPVCTLAFVAVVFGAAGMVAGFVCEPLAAAANNVSALCTRGMAAVSEAVAGLPFSSFKVENWTLWECAAWYAAFFAAAVAADFLLCRTRKGLEWTEPPARPAVPDVNSRTGP